MKVEVNRRPKSKIVRRKGRLYLETKRPPRNWWHCLYKMLSIVLGKALCGVGWHKWNFTLQDCIDEFGFLPNDSRMPKTAKCERCRLNYR